jgi:hypothetical protein
MLPVLAAVRGVAFGLAPGVPAATVQFHPEGGGGDPGFVLYRGETGERNQLKVDYLEIAEGVPCVTVPLTDVRCAPGLNRLIFSDAGALVIRPAEDEAAATLQNCLLLAVVASCVPRENLLVDLGLGADALKFRADAVTEHEPIFVMIRGGEGNDRLSGSAFLDEFFPGPGSDWVNGGPNFDRVRGVDGDADTIHCGGGFDHVDADSLDEVAADCELVEIF